MKKFFLLITASVLILSVAFANDDNNNGNNNLQAVPSVFIGKAGDCGTGTPAGSRIVTSAWLAGMGLPDNGGMNGVAATANDPHFGLLLSKNGPTTDCSSAGASIKGLGTFTAPATMELGFDVRNGAHCGAGAPRFNITTSDNVTHFAGCADGTPTPAPQDPTQWTRIRFTPAQVFPPIAAGSTIKSVSIVYDEGTDAPSAQDPNGVGLAVIDNIDVNGHIITSGPGDNGNGKGNGEDKDDQ